LTKSRRTFYAQIERPSFSHSLGHEDQFPVPGMSARYGFRKETITGTRGNDADAPIPAVRRITIIRLESSHSGRGMGIVGSRPASV
jgi:hypothetical protein